MMGQGQGKAVLRRVGQWDRHLWLVNARATRSVSTPFRLDDQNSHHRSLTDSAGRGSGSLKTAGPTVMMILVFHGCSAWRLTQVPVPGQPVTHTHHPPAWNVVPGPGLA
jgi:hypothetical protein